MEIIHQRERLRFYAEENGHNAYVDYQIKNGKLDIRHTVVPQEIGGRGIAAALVRAACDYALKEGLEPAATCPYAVKWLERHPEYVPGTGKNQEAGNAGHPGIPPKR